jgi:hypothetical protein
MLALTRGLLAVVSFLVVLTSALNHLAFGEIDAVRLDVSSGNLTEPLPFDVPFILIGKAPPATFLVTVQYQEKGDERNPPSLQPETPLESGVNAEGEFRLRLPPLDANHEFVFHLTFDRRLSTIQAREFRRAIASIFDRELRTITVGEIGIEMAQVVRNQLAEALERAVNNGEPIPAKPGEVTIMAPDTLFDPSMTERIFRDELLRLSVTLVSRQADREQELRRYRETISNFEEDLARVSASPELEAFLEALERRPELDARNPRNILFLPEASRNLLTLNEAEVAAVARGQSLTERPVELEVTFRAGDADAFRTHFLRTERALGELRDWLSSLVVPGGANRRYVEQLLEAGALTAGAVGRLQALAQTGQGSIHRAQRWAETLGGYVYALEKSLTARERALEDMAVELEAQAVKAVIRQSSITDSASTRANLYIGLDLGVLYAPDLERGALYFGANVYFGLKRRLSVTVGITVTDLGLEDDERIQPLLGSRSNLVLGVGYRLAKSMRVSGGALLFLKDDPNPLVTQTALTATPYAAFSFDADLVGALRALTR